MIRLTNAINTPELADGLVPTRFLFFIIGPPLVDVCYHELGRSIATLMVDKVKKGLAFLNIFSYFPSLFLWVILVILNLASSIRGLGDLNLKNHKLSEDLAQGSSHERHS